MNRRVTRTAGTRQRERIRQLEADLAHINRISVMAELAASIVDEVNHPLSGIVSNASACLRWLASDVPNIEEVREALSDIVRDGKRAGAMISHFPALTKKAQVFSERFDLNETITRLLVLAGIEAQKEAREHQNEFCR